MWLEIPRYAKPSTALRVMTREGAIRSRSRNGTRPRQTLLRPFPTGTNTQVINYHLPKIEQRPEPVAKSLGPD